jgi:hypothetical protein
MLLTGDNWDKNCDRQTDIKDETITIRTQLLKLRHSVPFTNPFLALRSPSTQSTITNVHIFRTLSYFFLLAADRWLSECCRRFIPLWESQNFRTLFQEYFSLWIRKTWDIWFPEPNFAGHRNRALEPLPPPQKKKKLPGLLREKGDEIGPYLCTEWTLRGGYYVQFVHT